MKTAFRGFISGLYKAKEKSSEPESSSLPKLKRKDKKRGKQYIQELWVIQKV